MWYIYLLLCKDGTIYTGITNDLKKRFKAHRNGKGAKYTRARGVVKILYSEKKRSRGAALGREAAIKKFSKIQKKNLAKIG